MLFLALVLFLYYFWYNWVFLLKIFSSHIFLFFNLYPDLTKQAERKGISFQQNYYVQFFYIKFRYFSQSKVRYSLSHQVSWRLLLLVVIVKLNIGKRENNFVQVRWPLSTETALLRLLKYKYKILHSTIFNETHS